MMASIIALFVFDAVFLVTEIHLWTQKDASDPVWQTLRPMHGFGIVCFAVINVLKIVLLVFVCKGISLAGKAVQAR